MSSTTLYFPLRLSCFLYVAAMIVASLLIIFPSTLPNQATEYSHWFAIEARSTTPFILPGVGSAATIITWLSAFAMLFNQRWARWPFAVATAVALLDGLVVGIYNSPPPILDPPICLAMDEITSVLAGMVLVLAFYNVRPPSAAGA